MVSDAELISILPRFCINALVSEFIISACYFASYQSAIYTCTQLCTTT